MLKYRFFTVQTRGSEEIWLKVCGKFCVITERRSRTSWVPPQGVKVSVSQTPQHNTSTNAWLCLRCRERENTRRCLKPVLSHPGGAGCGGGEPPPGLACPGSDGGSERHSVGLSRLHLEEPQHGRVVAQLHPALGGQTHVLCQVVHSSWRDREGERQRERTVRTGIFKSEKVWSTTNKVLFL